MAASRQPCISFSDRRFPVKVKYGRRGYTPTPRKHLARVLLMHVVAYFYRYRGPTLR